jgi:eukaryotic-like serine/threonine-protein kinase
MFPPTVKLDGDKDVPATQPGASSPSVPSSPNDPASPNDPPSPNDPASPNHPPGPNDATASPAATAPSNDALSPDNAVSSDDAPSPCDAVSSNEGPSPNDPTRTSAPRSVAPSDDQASVSHTPTSAAPRAQERYQIIGEHGRGGLGRVSRAHDHELGRDVAIKELIARNHVSEVRFFREAMITARLEHPGIVPVHEAGRWPDGTPFYAMKLVAGRPLRELIAERATVDERIGLLHHVIAVADAIAYAHGRNIIHRDLKPGNVIVGDFGETIVIDWGLAKDLSAADEPTLPAGPFRVTPGNDLTNTGSILGTPAYMAPEQERGEQVDQRADVFAIGAMLWELCDLQKVPPTEPRLRHRMLRRSGIDRDLITIIDKALAPDPAHRYPDAGALAADLKAFKSGARIAARSYSLLAMLAHWTRRHRTFALAIAVGIAISVAASLLYVQSITAERNRADSARIAANSANAATSAALAEQMLGHAEVLLNSDPSAAIDLLRAYQGGDRFRHSLLRAQAEGRGVARIRATPHTDSVIWMHGLPGESIATLSSDGSVAITKSEGSSFRVVRSSNVRDSWAYSEQRSLLAYACAENAICLLDFARSSPAIVATLTSPNPEGMAFSPDSRRLVASSRTSDLAMWDISQIEQPRILPGYRAHGFNVGFLDEDTVIAVDSDTTTVVIGMKTSKTITIHGASNTIASSQYHEFAIGTTQGTAMLLIGRSGSIALRARLCDGPLKTMQYTSLASVLACGCKDGRIGLWHADSSAVSPLANIQGSANELAMSADGRYLAAGGTSGALSIIDLHTGVTASYIGHNGRISAIAAVGSPSRAFATADLNGNIRTWDPPLPLAQVSYTASSRLYDVQFLHDSSSLATTSIDPYLHFIRDRRPEDVASHEPGNILLELAPDGNHFASYGSQNNIELWSGAERRIAHVIDAQHSETVQLKFLTSNEIMYANNRGHILRWSALNGISDVTEFHQPISTFVPLPVNELVVELSDGTLWRAGSTKEPVAIPQQHPQEHLMQLSNDQRWLATGNGDGDVAVYDTHTWRAVLKFHSTGPVHHVAMSPTNKLLAVAMKSGEIYLGKHPLKDELPDWSKTTWDHFSAHPRFLAYSPDGDLLMITNSDGVIIFYSALQDRWLYFNSGGAGLTALRTTQDGAHAATVDSNGRLLSLDLNFVRNLLSATPNHTDNHHYEEINKANSTGTQHQH